jgi:endonuclease/exonuclease/phosphatase family metal-dependent hydrolase
MRSLAAGRTFPAKSPERQLDHVLTDDPTLTATRVDAPEMSISDHRPLVVDIERRS